MTLITCPECHTHRFTISIAFQGVETKNKTELKKYLTMSCHNIKCKLFNYHLKTPPYERQLIQIHNTEKSQKATGSSLRNLGSKRRTNKR